MTIVDKKQFSTTNLMEVRVENEDESCSVYTPW